jgi:hypothetical protein
VTALVRLQDDALAILSLFYGVSERHRSAMFGALTSGACCAADALFTPQSQCVNKREKHMWEEVVERYLVSFSLLAFSGGAGAHRCHLGKPRSC